MNEEGSSFPLQDNYSVDPLKDNKPVASSLPGEVPDSEHTIPSMAKENGPNPPQEPTPEEKFLLWTKEVASRINTLEENQAKLVKFLETVKPQLEGPQAAQGVGGMGISDVIKLITSQLGSGSDPLADTKMQIGEKFLNGVLDTAVKRVIKDMSGEAAIHVAHG